MLDSLKELSGVISNVVDPEVAEDLTEIYEDLTSCACKMSQKYWKLVRTLAVVEKECDQLSNELNVLVEDDYIRFRVIELRLKKLKKINSKKF